MTRPTNTRWEYRVEDFGGFMKTEPKNAEVQSLLNAWGEEGWELVSAVYSSGTTRLRIIAKRPQTAAARRLRKMAEWDAELA